MNGIGGRNFGAPSGLYQSSDPQGEITTKNSDRMPFDDLSSKQKKYFISGNCHSTDPAGLFKFVLSNKIPHPDKFNAIAVFLLKKFPTLFPVFIERTRPSELDLSYQNLNPESTKLLALTLKENTTITRLKLRDTNFEEEGYQAIVNVLLENTSIVELDLSECDIGNEGIKSLAEVLKKNCSLNILDISLRNFDTDGLKDIEAGLKENQTLTSICFEIHDSNVAGMPSLMNVLSQHKSIISLNVDSSCYQNAAADSALVDMIEGSKILQNLTIITGRVTADATREIVLALTRCASPLTHLVLTLEELGSIGEETFNNFLTRCASLKSLCLSNCGLQRASVIAISEILCGNTSMIELKLLDATLDDAGFSAIADALTKNSTLQTLVLDNHGLGSAGLRALDEALQQNKKILNLEFIRDLHGRHLSDGAVADPLILKSIGDSLQRNQNLASAAFQAYMFGATAGAFSQAEHNLPNEIVGLISTLLDPQDAQNLAATSRSARDLAKKMLEDHTSDQKGPDQPPKET